MSQAAPTLPAGFLATPTNPHTEKIKAAMEPAPTPTPAPAPAPVPPAPVAPNPVVPPVAPQPAAPAPAPAPPVTHPVAPVYTPPAQPQMTAAEQMLLRRMEEERQQLQQQNEAKDQAIQNLLEQQAEYEELKRQMQVRQALSTDAFSQLETLDPEDAKRISEAVLNASQAATQSLVNPLKKELEETRKLVEQRTAMQTQQTERARIEALNQQILSVHPDFFALQNTPEYQQFMTQRDGLSSKTRDQRAAEEFLAGNTAYVIDVLNQMKGAIPSAAQITTVAPVQVATTNGVPAAPAEESTMTLRDLNNLYQMRQITHDQYRSELAKIRAANPV